MKTDRHFLSATRSSRVLWKPSNVAERRAQGLGRCLVPARIALSICEKRRPVVKTFSSERKIKCLMRSGEAIERRVHRALSHAFDCSLWERRKERVPFNLRSCDRHVHVLSIAEQRCRKRRHKHARVAFIINTHRCTHTNVLFPL